MSALQVLDAAINVATDRAQHAHRKLAVARHRGTGVLGAEHTYALNVQMVTGLSAARRDLAELIAASSELEALSVCMNTKETTALKRLQAAIAQVLP